MLSKKNALSIIKKISNSLPTGLALDDAKEMLLTLSDISKNISEIKKTEVEIEQLRIKENIIIKEMEKKHQLYNEMFISIFKERSASINKTFEIIDEGLMKNDTDLISMGLNNLSNIVSSSPFSNLSELSKLLDSGTSIEI